MASIKLSPLPLPLFKPLTPSPPFFPLKFPFPPIRIMVAKHPVTQKTHAFYTERTPVSPPPPKSNKPNASDPDDISILNERIRRELGKRERSQGGKAMDSKEAETYIKSVKQQQQRGLQKLKGDVEGNGFGYRVDPYLLRPGDYVVHKKVGIGRFVAIKYDVGGKGSSEPVEYVFIEYGDGMAKLPVKQAARMLYRYNLPNESKKPRTLSKLNDTSAWEKRRIKGKIAIQKMVVDLMELYLHRLKQKRPPYPKNPVMAEFAAQFLYEPTPDQKQERFIKYRLLYLGRKFLTSRCLPIHILSARSFETEQGIFNIEMLVNIYTFCYVILGQSKQYEFLSSLVDELYE